MEEGGKGKEFNKRRREGKGMNEKEVERESN